MVYLGQVDLMFDDNSNTPLISLKEGGVFGDGIVINEPELMSSV